TDDSTSTSSGTEEILSSNQIDIVQGFQKGLAALARLSKKHQARPHQKTAIEKVIAGFNNHDRGKLILPCGTGKTETALWIKEKLKPKKTLILFPSIALVKQTKDRWQEQKSSNYDYLCVCSDPGVDSSKEENDSESEHEEFEALRDSKVSNDPEVIKRFLDNNDESVVFATYQSLPKIIEAMKDNDIEFDLTIADEAHKTTGQEGNLFTQMHNNENLRSKKRLYMTATERILSEKSGELIGMNDESIYGPEFHRMSFAEAIAAKILVEYKLVVLGIKPGQTNKILEKNQIQMKDVDLRSVASCVALEQFMHNNGLRRALTFHSRRQGAEYFAKTRKILTGNQDSYYVDGTMPVKLRNQILDKFKNAIGRSTASNARCLSEGVDVPSIDCVVFADPKSKEAKVDIVQAAGRAMRKDPNNPKKDTGYIVLPIMLKADGKPDTDSPSFKGLIEVISSLALHDERLETIITGKQNDESKDSPQHPEIIFTGLGEDLNGLDSSEFNFDIKEEIIACSREMLTGSRFENFEQAKEALLKAHPNKPSKLNYVTALPVKLATLNKLAQDGNLTSVNLKEKDMINLIWDNARLQVDIELENRLNAFVEKIKKKHQRKPGELIQTRIKHQFTKEFHDKERIKISSIFNFNTTISTQDALIEYIFGKSDDQEIAPAKKKSDKELISSIRKKYPFCPKNHEDVLANDSDIKSLSFYYKSDKDLAVKIWNLSPMDSGFGNEKNTSRASMLGSSFFHRSKPLTQGYTLSGQRLIETEKLLGTEMIDFFYALREKYPQKISLQEIERQEFYQQNKDKLDQALNELREIFGDNLAARISAYIWGDNCPILNLKQVIDDCRKETRLDKKKLCNILERNGNSCDINTEQLNQILDNPDKYTSLQSLFDSTKRLYNFTLLDIGINEENLRTLLQAAGLNEIKASPLKQLERLVLASRDFKDKLMQLYINKMEENQNKIIRTDETLSYYPQSNLDLLTLAELIMVAKLLGHISDTKIESLNAYAKSIQEAKTTQEPKTITQLQEQDPNEILLTDLAKKPKPAGEEFKLPQIKALGLEVKQWLGLLNYAINQGYITNDPNSPQNNSLALRDYIWGSKTT
ncbi:MAG: DEAD/DEAH box helicase family protein, partial [Candidatus Caenarcaniphilales bacterium]|nr:DEAD/DEAH box helicase family protein [Candidatus Caenarcaniphilales bacterium]